MTTSIPRTLSTTTWALVADRSEARIFERRTSRGAFERVDVLVHPRGRLHAHEAPHVLDADADGTPRETLPIERAPGDHEDETFAKTIAERLRRGRTEGRFDRLVVAAEPALLGRIRAALDEPTKKLVHVEIPKHLGGHPDGDVVARLASIVRLGAPAS